jgi:DNA-binding HxlR family transcriptional regulator
MDTVFSETFVAPPRNVRPGECVVDAALNLIGGKWKGVIVYHLLDGPLRFSQVKRHLPGVTQRMLTKQLRELEAAGLVHRTVYAQVPPRVDYRLTEAGRTLSPVILALRAWGEAHLRMGRHRRVGEDRQVGHVSASMRR